MPEKNIYCPFRFTLPPTELEPGLTRQFCIKDQCELWIEPDKDLGIQPFCSLRAPGLTYLEQKASATS